MLISKFYIRGVDYQPGGSSGYLGRSDPLSDIDACSRDIYMFQQLGLNSIRVYTVNPDLNHDACMSLLAAAGIYLILDVNSPRIGESLNRYEPWTTFTPEYFEHIFRVVHQFAGYNNTLGFFAGNEVINDEKSAGASPSYIRAVVRDIKLYLASNSLRRVPIGYSAADDLKFRNSLAEYLACGSHTEAVDFYGVNSYQWCGDQTFQTSGYDTLVHDYSDYPLPLFLSEFGCNAITPRTFQEVEALYSTQMTPVFSGGLVYEYSQGPNNYGLVEVGAKGEVFMREDFENLRERMNSLTWPPELTKPASSKNEIECSEQYENLFVRPDIPSSVASDYILSGVPNATLGRFTTDMGSLTTNYTIFRGDGSEVQEKTIHIGQSPPSYAKIVPAPVLQAETSSSAKSSSSSSAPLWRSPAVTITKLGEKKSVGFSIASRAASNSQNFAIALTFVLAGAAALICVGFH